VQYRIQENRFVARIYQGSTKAPVNADS